MNTNTLQAGSRSGAETAAIVIAVIMAVVRAAQVALNMTLVHAQARSMANIVPSSRCSGGPSRCGVPWGWPA